MTSRYMKKSPYYQRPYSLCHGFYSHKIYSVIFHHMLRDQDHVMSLSTILYKLPMSQSVHHGTKSRIFSTTSFQNVGHDEVSLVIALYLCLDAPHGVPQGLLTGGVQHLLLDCCCLRTPQEERQPLLRHIVMHESNIKNGVSTLAFCLCLFQLLHEIVV